MGLFDIFSKRDKFIPLHDKVWQVIKPHLTVSADPADEIAQRLALFDLAGAIYSAVYQSALATGMNSSSAYSLARSHLGKCPFEADLREAVDAIFSADPGSRERTYAEALQATMGRVVAGVAGSGAAVDPAAELAELARCYAAMEFAREGLYPPSVG